MQEDRTDMAFDREELRPEATAHRGAGGSSARRSPADRRARTARPRLSSPWFSIPVVAVALCAVAASPVLAGKPAYPPGRATPAPTIEPSPTLSPTPAPTPFPSPAPTATPSPSASPSGYPVQYSDSYWEQYALTGGGASNGCWMTVMLNQIENAICTADYDPWWLYPDGTWAQCTWHADATIPTGWAPDECYVDPYFEGY